MSYPQEVAILLPPTLAVLDLETRTERRTLQGDEQDAKVFVTRRGPNPLPNLDLKGPHIDIITDEAGNVGQRSPKRVYDTSRRLEKPNPNDGHSVTGLLAALEHTMVSNSQPASRQTRPARPRHSSPVKPIIRGRKGGRPTTPVNPLAQLGRRKHGVR